MDSLGECSVCLSLPVSPVSQVLIASGEHFFAASFRKKDNWRDRMEEGRRERRADGNTSLVSCQFPSVSLPVYPVTALTRDGITLFLSRWTEEL